MPPKKKETNKKPEAAKPPTLIDGLTKEEMSEEQMEEHIVRLREELEREREERNYFQLERDNIQSFREVADRKLEEAKAELKNLEKAIEDDEQHHQVEIKVFKQKMKHLLCEHQNTVAELEADIAASAEVLQDEQNQLEAEMYKDMITIQVDMHEFNSKDLFTELQLKHAEEMAAARDKWEKLLAEAGAKNEAEIQQLQEEQGSMLKSVICERELLWKSHIDMLNEDVERYLIEANDILDGLYDENLEKIKDLQRRVSQRMIEHETNKEALTALLKENEETAELESESKDQLNRLERRAKCFSQSEHPIRNPQKKNLEDLKTQDDDLANKFSKLQVEVDELRSSVPQKIQSAQKRADLSLRPLEDELQALKDRLEKVEAQLHSVLSAPNLDQTALTEITYKVEKDLEARNAAIKNLKHKRYISSQGRSALLLRTEGFVSMDKRS